MAEKNILLSEISDLRSACLAREEEMKKLEDRHEMAVLALKEWEDACSDCGVLPEPKFMRSTVWKLQNRATPDFSP